MYMKDLFLPKSSEVVTQPFIDYLCSIYRLDHFGNHGVEHWLRVLYTGRIIADAVMANVKVVELFALLHDCRRNNEGSDPEHGQRSAQLAERLRGQWFEVTDNEMWQLTEALRHHSDGKTFHHPTVQACWDADRLDVSRLGVRLDPLKLCHTFSKRPSILDGAIQRSALCSGFNAADVGVGDQSACEPPASPQKSDQFAKANICGIKP
jgi:uncharacterized protein